MNIDELKRNWNSLNLPADTPMPEVRDLEDKVATQRVTTLRDRIYRLHIRLSIVACVAILTMVPFAKDEPWLVAFATLFFVLMAALHAATAFWVHGLDYSRMTVKDALRSVYELERRRNRNRAIGVALAVPLICYMCYTFSNGAEPAFFFGCVSGACLGVLIGLIINHKAVMMLREMKRELGDD